RPGTAQAIAASIGGQADMEPARHGAWGRLFLGDLIKSDFARRQAVPRVEGDADRPAEIQKHGAVAPDHARRFGARGLLALLGQLGEDPAALFADGFINLAQRHPLRRADRKAFGADNEADAAPARAPQEKADAPALEYKLAGRARMPQPIAPRRDGLGRERRLVVEEAALQRIDDAAQAAHDLRAH